MNEATKAFDSMFGNVIGQIEDLQADAKLLKENNNEEVGVEFNAGNVKRYEKQMALEVDEAYGENDMQDRFDDGAFN